MSSRLRRRSTNATNAAVPSRGSRTLNSSKKAVAAVKPLFLPMRCIWKNAYPMPVAKISSKIAKISTDQPARRPWLPRKVQRSPRSNFSSVVEATVSGVRVASAGAGGASGGRG